jgi:hypothetical protein
MLQADPSKVSARAKKRGLPQLGTLGTVRFPPLDANPLATNSRGHWVRLVSLGAVLFPLAANPPGAVGGSGCA